MSRKETIDALFARKSERDNVSCAGEKDRVRTGAISAMGSSLRELTEGARAAARLQEQIETGSIVAELDPVALDGSMVSDRLPAEVDSSFDDLVESIRENGQLLPILARPHPMEVNRYQIAYGHRRVRAAAALGIKVRAIIKPLTDTELVIAQGKENLERRDLSYIEKALFARRLEDQGFDRTVIIAALSTDKADLSRYIAVARLIPEPLAQAIGPAAKAGRSRWLALSELIIKPRSEAIVEGIVGSPVFRKLDSDGRFACLFEALVKPGRRSTLNVRTWSIPEGPRAAKIETREDRTTLTIDENLVPAFGQFVTDRLDGLYHEYLKTKQEERNAS